MNQKEVLRIVVKDKSILYWLREEDMTVLERVIILLQLVTECIPPSH